MDLREIGIDGENWILLVQGMVRWWAFVSTVMNHKESRIFFDKPRNCRLLNNVLHHAVSK
jgi:hypothetical protein